MNPVAWTCQDPCLPQLGSASEADHSRSLQVVLSSLGSRVAIWIGGFWTSLPWTSEPKNRTNHLAVQYRVLQQMSCTKRFGLPLWSIGYFGCWLSSGNLRMIFQGMFARSLLASKTICRMPSRCPAAFNHFPSDVQCWKATCYYSSRDERGEDYWN